MREIIWQRSRGACTMEEKGNDHDHDMIRALHYECTYENTLSLLIVPRVTNIHLSPSALMNEVTRRNKGFL